MNETSEHLELILAFEARRDALGMNTAAVSRKAGMSRHWASKFFNGTRNSKLYTLLKVADALDCDLEMKLVPR